MTRQHHNRHGAAILIVLVLILIIGALAATTINEIYRDRVAFRQEQLKQQTGRLMDDALVRTVRLLEKQPDYSGETVFLKDLPLPVQGTLEISVQVIREEEQIIVTGIFLEEFSNRKVCDIQKTTNLAGRRLEVPLPIETLLPTNDNNPTPQTGGW